ncbi:ATP-grasp domain-containing protein [Geobacillus thermoleovorans]|uniref:hypothetical protein n=1 Tax=Geobacillus thermoleovorans TaxID=33941 RepID=UPI00325BF35F
MKQCNVLFSSSGRRVSLIQHFRKVLNDLKINGVIVTADMKPTSPAAFVSDHHELVPPVSDDRYIPTLKSICKTYDIPSITGTGQR